MALRPGQLLSFDVTKPPFNAAGTQREGGREGESGESGERFEAAFEAVFRWKSDEPKAGAREGRARGARGPPLRLAEVAQLWKR